MSKGRKENLGDFRDLTAEEQRAIASKGGKASVAARRAKKKLKELVELMGEKKADPMLQERMKDMGISKEDLTNNMACVVGLFQKAMAGAVQAFNAIRDIRGEKPVDKTELNGSLDTDVNIGFVAAGVKLAGSVEEVDE